MTSAAPAKFRFDLDLGHREERNSVMTDSARPLHVMTLASTTLCRYTVMPFSWCWVRHWSQ